MSSQTKSQKIRERAITSLVKHIRKITRIGIVILAVLQLIHPILPDFAKDVFHLSIIESIGLAIILFMIERLIIIQEIVEEELVTKRRLWIYKFRTESYDQVCRLLKDREVKQLDLLQFSGVTSLPVINEVAKKFPHAKVNLFLTSSKFANKFDEQGFHSHRIQHTMGEILLIKQKNPNFDIKVYRYDSEPAISGIMIDNWLVSVGWYHVFPISSTVLSIRGHEAPSIVAIDEKIEPFHSFFENHLKLILNSAQVENIS
jgi:hypothetical protein